MDRARLAAAIAAYGKQMALANALGVGDSTISRWLATGHISLAHFVRLCVVLGVSADWLLGLQAKPAEVRIRKRWALTDGDRTA